jgi:hypothetical protein
MIDPCCDASFSPLLLFIGKRGVPWQAFFTSKKKPSEISSSAFFCCYLKKTQKKKERRVESVAEALTQNQ